MSNRRNALGRGIGALIPTAPSPQPAEAVPVLVDEGPAEIPVDAIDPNPEQPRRSFDPVELGRLADSIRQHGVLQHAATRGPARLPPAPRRAACARRAATRSTGG